MTDFEEQLAADLKDALRSGDEDRKRTLRLLIAELKNATIDSGGDLDDAQIQAVLRKQARQRRDSIEQFSQGGREELAAAEERELAIIQEYLPEAMSADEVEEAARHIIDQTGAKDPSDMGLVMGPLMQQLGGRADGKMVSQTVKRLLSS